MITAMITGHRQGDVIPYGNSPLQEAIRYWMKNKLIELQQLSQVQNVQLTIISGMAIGVDQWWAEEALSLGLDVHAYIPFQGQDSRWPPSTREHYAHLLSRCRKTVLCATGGHAQWKFQRRNEMMVDNSTHHYGVWNGHEIGGTWNCIEYIRKKSITPILFDEWF